MGRVLSTIVAAVCVAALAAGCGGEDAEEHDLTFTSPTIEAIAVDEAKKGSSAADFRAFTHELFEEGTDEPVGRLDGTVVITDVGERDGTEVEYRFGGIQFTLDDGNIVASGNYVAEPGVANPAEGGVDRPIVGGTGAYRGASGEVNATAEGDEGVRYELDFETPSE